MRKLNFDIIRHVDQRRLNCGPTSAHALVAELVDSKPSLIIGILRASATQVGTAIERHVSVTLAMLFKSQIAGGGNILFVGPEGNRYLNQPSLDSSYLVQYQHDHER